MRRIYYYCYSLLLVLLLSSFIVTAGGDDDDNNNNNDDDEEWEKRRVEEYHRHGYKWPIPQYLPNTKGWKELHERRFKQVAEIKDETDRYEGYAQTLTSGLVQPNFTEHGFALARAPDDLMNALRQGIHDGLDAGPRFEHNIPIIEGDKPWFIDRPDLTERVLKELQFYPETWTGMELTPVIAYGFRLYRNNSRLNMHLDKTATHIISFILHIDSSEDAEPWPITIEDLNGKTHEVILTSGDMLLYESSKCLHGRPRTFKGSWYSSVFVHYHPKFIWLDDPSFDHKSKKVWAIPPHWKDEPTTTNEVPLVMTGTGMKEPSCPNNWCNSETSIKWSGPGQDGYIVSPTGEKVPFEPKKLICEDWHPSCPTWAKWSTNECRRNPSYMLSHCKKSCNACTIETDDDHDNNNDDDDDDYTENNNKNDEL